MPTDIVQKISWSLDVLNNWVLCPAWHKTGHYGDVPQGSLLAWYGKTKPNTTKARISPLKTNVLQHKINTKKHKARFSRLLRHPAWKRRGSILILALHKSVTYWIRHLPNYFQQRTHMGQVWTCSYWDMWANRQTGIRHTDHNILHTWRGMGKTEQRQTNKIDNNQQHRLPV